MTQLFIAPTLMIVLLKERYSLLVSPSGQGGAEIPDTSINY